MQQKKLLKREENKTYLEEIFERVRLWSRQSCTNQKSVFIKYLYVQGYLSFSSFFKEVQREEITTFFVLFEL